jgi:CrcB protein
VGIGFCGGLTTFSTFAVESAELLRDQRAALAAAYVGASVGAALLAAVAGAAVSRRVGALRLPLEGPEAPV